MELPNIFGKNPINQEKLIIDKIIKYIFYEN